MNLKQILFYKYYKDTNINNDKKTCSVLLQKIEKGDYEALALPVI